MNISNTVAMAMSASFTRNNALCVSSWPSTGTPTGTMPIVAFDCAHNFAYLAFTMNVASPETTSHGKRDVAFDKYLSGTYLITAIRHMFNNDKGETGYKMLVEMTKDGLDDRATTRIPRKLGNE